MTDHGILSRRPYTRFVVVAITDETIQAMACVALDGAGFHPLATTDDREALLLSANLSTSPVAIVTTCPGLATQGRFDRLGRLLRGRRGPRPPIVVLGAAPTTDPRQLQCASPPDLASMLDSLAALTVS